MPIAADDLDGLVAFAKENEADFVVVGPEAPLVAGLVDRLEHAGIKAFGPSADAAILEGSKGFMKDLCAKYGIPTAAYGRFTDAEDAKAFIRERGAPIVVKADGLAAGKGVIVAQSEQEALDAVDAIMADRAFGEAGAEVVVEEFLDGEEASFLAICDGTNFVPLASAQDHKAVGDGDTGPNTGGMGAYSPAPVIDEAMEQTVIDTVIAPTVAAMAAEGRPFKGVLYAGLMIGADGVPKVLEFNARFGDPECQPLMVRLMSDLLPCLIAARDGVLEDFDLRWYDDAALCVVMAANGYPGSYDKGTEISGLDAAGALDERHHLPRRHRGCEDGKVVATGGRVLGVTATGATIEDAQNRAYQAVDRIDWPEGFCRRDIGWRAIARGK